MLERGKPTSQESAMSDGYIQPLDDNDIQMLSDEPLEGLIQLIDLIKVRYGKGKNSYSSYEEKIAYEYIGAYITARPESLPKGLVVPRSIVNIESFKSNLLEALKDKKAEEKVDLIREHARFAFTKQMSSKQIRLDSGYKEQIRGFIDQIRRILDTVDLPPGRKQEIISKINQLSDEIEKEYSRLDRLGDLWLSLTRSLGEGAKNLEPAVRLVERVRKVFSAAQEDGEQKLLTDATAKRELPPPSSSEVGDN